ncbi:DUF7452 domain-containing protein [Marinicella meishanensis]|uniref:DUF7452 domain-containing protein n=1 Tax=Marinicella meishanensis TaxID=2873263 RepID=UPI001CBF3A14|nr:hypothetical protein [Marinicella sp. NBU2979]
MKYLKFTLIGLLGWSMINTTAQAADHIWSGAGSLCGDSLDVCANAAAPGDRVLLHIDGPIDEGVSLTGPGISIMAGEGYRPVFAAGHRIDAYLTGGLAEFSGLTFVDGNLYLIVDDEADSALEIRIKHNNINKDHSGHPIVISNNADVEVTAHISNNRLRTLATDTGQSTVYLTNYAANANMQVELIGNSMHAQTSLMTIGNNGAATNAAMAVVLQANKFYSRYYGNEFGNFAPGATFSVHAESNLINMLTTSSFSTAMRFRNDGGDSMAVTMVNNTLMDRNQTFNLGEAIRVLNTGAAADFSFEYHNNIMQDFNTGIWVQGDAMVSNSFNLYHNISFHSNFVPETPDTDPLLDRYGRLLPLSPAIDAADASILAGSLLPYLDMDGLYREKDGNGDEVVMLDIGAHEFGVVSHQHVHAGPVDNISNVSHASMDGYPGLIGLHVTHQFNLDGGLSGFYNNANSDLEYIDGSGLWRIYNYGGFDIQVGSVFNILNIAKTFTTFEVQQSGAANFVEIDRTGLNGRPEKIVHVMQKYDSSNPGFNDHPVGINYLIDRWYVQNLDAATLPLNTTFNVYYQDPSISAFKHTVGSGNIHPDPVMNYATMLNNPLINGWSCAQLQVTQSAETGLVNPAPVGVRFDNTMGRWLIYNQDTSPMPAGATFHVLLDPAQIEVCTDEIFITAFD